MDINITNIVLFQENGAGMTYPALQRFFVHSDALLKENIPPVYAAYNRLVSKKNVQQ